MALPRRGFFRFGSQILTSAPRVGPTASLKSPALQAGKALRRWDHGNRPFPRCHHRCSGTAAATLQQVDDASLSTISDSRPLVIHCDTPWSKRSERFAQQLTAWAETQSEVLCATLDAETCPEFVATRRLTVLPAVVLLFRGRTIEVVDGSDPPEALDELLLAAQKLGADDGETAPVEEQASSETMRQELHLHVLLANADAMLQSGQVGDPVPLLKEALSANDGVGAFRARLGLLRSALQKNNDNSEYISDVAAALEDLRANHEAELVEANTKDAAVVHRLLAHAGLLVDASAAENGPKKEILESYVAGLHTEALEKALTWYQIEASDEDQMKQLLTSPYWQTAVGPVEPRAILERLFVAIGVRSKEVTDARFKLTFLLDKKEWIPFKFRRLNCFKGGHPRLQRNGKWIIWGPAWSYRNTKPMDPRPPPGA